jgi:hypothetical protein
MKHLWTTTSGTDCGPWAWTITFASSSIQACFLTPILNGDPTSNIRFTEIDCNTSDPSCIGDQTISIYASFRSGRNFDT